MFKVANFYLSVYKRLFDSRENVYLPVCLCFVFSCLFCCYFYFFKFPILQLNFVGHIAFQTKRSSLFCIIILVNRNPVPYMLNDEQNDIHIDQLQSGHYLLNSFSLLEQLPIWEAYISFWKCFELQNAWRKLKIHRAHTCTHQLISVDSKVLIKGLMPQTPFQLLE